MCRRCETSQIRRGMCDQEDHQHQYKGSVEFGAMPQILTLYCPTAHIDEEMSTRNKVRHRPSLMNKKCNREDNEGSCITSEAIRT
jgi:hypothetical protein